MERDIIIFRRNLIAEIQTRGYDLCLIDMIHQVYQNTEKELRYANDEIDNLINNHRGLWEGNDEE
jgi:hypothetical protein